ncbi:hypothetical protein D2A34_18680 [Clostridium chromiireducens]|uniref:NAD(P)-binding domain-containing protein n=1 Tax=Clostridium chromiireducens TaxID=225345 RepID=A0A399IQG3_9CLOT|nr:hypothetical protein D2A34_18680 [Clostridium chromiireducens]
MNECGINRLIDWATPSVRFKNDKKSFITVVPRFLGGILYPLAKKEIIYIADIITESNLNWTIVRFMAPKDTPFTGNVKVGFGDTKQYYWSRYQRSWLYWSNDRNYVFSSWS